MKILIDMNLSPRWVAMLAERGIEAVHWANLGPVNAPDDQIMNYARNEGYTVLTHDLDFSTILAATQGRKPSVVQIRGAEARPESIIEHVAHALTQAAEELAQGALVTVEPHKTRLRILPLAVRNNSR
jgi:predicted nuclease of predicted toxin-antitoxin system